MDYPSSSRYSHSRRNRDDRRRRRSRSRSRSRSPRYYSSSFLHGKKTSKELEIENDVLTAEVKELRAQMNQITAQLNQLNANLTTVSLARVQAESRAAHFEGEVNRINSCYQQCTDALRNLKTEFENIVKERSKWIEESDKFRKERDIADKSAENFRDQLSIISERNTSLVKKCEQLSAENKDYKEKQAKYDIELRELRPALANFEQELEKTQKELKLMTEENELLRRKEKTWILEKKEMEKRIFIKEAVILKERRSRSNESSDGSTDADKIKKLEVVIDSLQSHYESQLKDLQKQLEENPIPQTKPQKEESKI